jgi:serine protease
MPRPAFAALLAAVALSLSAAAHAAPIAHPTTLRVMLHPSTAAGDARARLEALVGGPVTVVGTTRTGAVDVALDEVRSPYTLKSLIARVRADRAVLWAEVPPTESSLKAARAKAASGAPGRKLMVRLADPARSIDDALAAWSSRTGVALRVARTLGSVHVLALAADVPQTQLASIAHMLEADPAFRYADPVRRVRPMRVPNDPMYPSQWALSDAVSGIDAPAAWDLQTGDPSMTVAVVDTGILPHPDLDGRVLPGYDFISDAASARDGDGRDPDPRDQGDWTSEGDCGRFFGEPSSWHGTLVAGLIAATGDNAIGIAGVDWNAKILPVRALGKCGGTDDDILAGVLWASGVQLPGVPLNTTPAKVINLSLGGEGPCESAVQEGIDDALAQGSVVVVAAGNSAEDATAFSPASCSGVITVGALARSGDRASYTNFGNRVDLSAPGGDFPGDDLLIVSTSNDGATIPGAPTYAFAAGTSLAAPLVTGTASLMLARNALLTPGHVLSILQGTARAYLTGSSCGAGACGSGILDAGLAVASTIPGSAAPPPNAVTVFEFYRADLDHYFITASQAEASFVDAALGTIFQRTGFYFYAYADAAHAPAGALPVCRFYAAGLINSHYYTANPNECAYVQSHWAGTWQLETSAAFYIQVPDANGACPAGTLPVYRFFDNRNDANHRYTVDLSLRRAMINRQWVPEGANGIVFCSPI